MRRFYTSDDVEIAVSRGKDVIYVSEDDIVTSVAREAAQRKGISFKTEENSQVDTRTDDKSTSPENKQASSTFENSRPVGRNGKLTDKEIEEWRKEFPILKDIIHVANCSQSAQARRVRAAINKYMDSWLTVGMDWDSWIEEVYEAKVEFARLINARPSEIAISTSVSEATASLASALDYTGARKKIVTTEAEFPTVNHVWLAHQKYGGKVDFVPVENGEIDILQYERHIDDETLLSSITHVYYQNGFKQDIKAISEIAHRKGSLIYIDAYQSLGTTPIDVKEMNIDILSSGNLKYLFGIPGVAFIYINQDLIPLLKPAVTGWFGQENPFAFNFRYLDYASDARRFDTGTPPVLTSYAARAGMAIVNEVGVANISERIDMLSKHAIEGSLERGLDLASPTDVAKKGGTTAIRVEMDSHQVEEELKKRNIIASARGDVIRVAPHFYTRLEDIDTVLDQIQDILKK